MFSFKYPDLRFMQLFKNNPFTGDHFCVFITCNREILDPDPHALPGFSTDTVTFDTVFTTIGSATLSFKVYNRSNRPLVISSIDLAGGDASFFRLNIDGEPKRRLSNVEIPPDDSLFIFIAVTVDPTNVNNPVVIKDSIIFNHERHHPGC